MWSPQKDMYGYGLSIVPRNVEKPPVVVAVWDGGTQETDAHSAWIEAQLAAGKAVFVADLSGMGQLEPYPCSPLAPLYANYGTMYKLCCDMLMLGDSIPALRTFDLLRALDVAKLLPCANGVVELYGAGRSALYAKLAAMLADPTIALSLDPAIENYAEFLARVPYDDTDILSHTLPGYLTHFA
jgi:hypothetical protein